MPQTASKTTEKLHEWRLTYNHRHAHKHTHVFACIPLSFLHFSQLVPCPSFLTLYSYHSFSLTLPASFPCSSDRRQPQTGNICPIFGLLVRPFHVRTEVQSSLFTQQMCRRRNNPTFYPAHSLHLLAIYLFSTKERVLCFTVCPPHLFLFLSLPHIRATLPLYLTLLAV